MPRWLRIVNWFAAILALALIAGSVAAMWTVRRSMPQTEGTITLQGLTAPVTVIRDAAGIPQVYADTSADLFFAQGYVQAQDRFFEMDFRRHLTAGRLTELFGRDALKADMFVRTLGWRRVAEAELPLLSTDTRRYLESFAAGVNAYLSGRSSDELSLEYAVLDLNGLTYTPEPWTSADSLAWLKAMAWNLGSNIDDEIDRSIESIRLTRQQIAELYPDYPYDEHQPVVTQAHSWTACTNRTRRGTTPGCPAGRRTSSRGRRPHCATPRRPAQPSTTSSVLATGSARTPGR